MSPGQRRVHIAAEFAALTVMVPALVYVAATSHRRPVAIGAAVLAVVTVLVDGPLLYRFATGVA